jgi:hypothetical protein
MFNNFFRKSRLSGGNVQEIGGARGNTNDVTIWRIRVECWISEATRTHEHARAQASGNPHKRTRTHTDTHTLTSM